MDLVINREKNWWVLFDMQLLSGLQNDLPIGIIVGNTYYGYHASRTPVLVTFNLSAGVKVPPKIKRKIAFAPDAFDLRIQNLSNLREATNLGSPFQGTRYLLPFRFLIGCQWSIGKEPSQIASSPNSQKAI